MAVGHGHSVAARQGHSMVARPSHSMAAKAAVGPSRWCTTEACSGPFRGTSSTGRGTGVGTRQCWQKLVEVLAMAHKGTGKGAHRHLQRQQRHAAGAAAKDKAAESTRW